jgi:hypothetical protein
LPNPKKKEVTMPQEYVMTQQIDFWPGALQMKKKQPPPNAGLLLKMLRSQCKQLEAAGAHQLLTQEVKAWWNEQKEEERIREEAAQKKKNEEIKKKLAQFNKLKQELEMDGVI